MADRPHQSAQSASFGMRASLYVVLLKPVKSLNAPSSHATVTSGELSSGPMTGMGSPQVVTKRRGDDAESSRGVSAAA